MGLLFHWLVLKKFTDLAHSHVAIWCDNTPTVAWATKLLAAKAVLAVQLLRMLALRMILCCSSPLTMLHVPGNLNCMADFASQSFIQCMSSQDFLTEFHNHFKLPRNACWLLCQLPSMTTGCVLANKDIKSGVVASIHKMHVHYWHWCQLLPTSVDPYLHGLDQSEQLCFLHVFAQQTQEGTFGQGWQVQTGSIQAALDAISKAIKLDGLPNPLHKAGTTNYHATLMMQMKSYKWEDPAMIKQLTVPVDVPKYIYHTTRKAVDCRIKTIREMILIAFYFLLRVREYTHHRQGQ